MVWEESLTEMLNILRQKFKILKNSLDVDDKNDFKVQQVSK